jgi:FkbM family methyltransferase
MLKHNIKKFLYGSRLYPFLQAIASRENAREARRLCQFYRQFISPGELVFDVGANIGEYSDAFLRLGARVVAIEPNPRLHDSLTTLAKRGGMAVEKCAVGDVTGSATLSICDQSYFSSLNTEWLKEARTLPYYQTVHFTDEVKVPVVTLDELATKHGIPAFVKIDIEGYEDKALAGMSFRPRSFSFEFSTAVRDVALRCLDWPGLQSYKLNAIGDRCSAFLHDEWLSPEAMRRCLVGYTAINYGDIFARRSH